MQIVCYQDSYKEQVIGLILDIQNQEAKINLTLEEQPDLYDIQTSYIRSGGNFWIALNERGEVIGTIGLMKKQEGYAILKKFFVHSGYRRQKVGYELYQTLMEYCVKNQVKAILLDTPSVAKDSHRFYEKNGFVRIAKEDLPIPYEYPDRNSYLYFHDLSRNPTADPLFCEK